MRSRRSRERQREQRREPGKNTEAVESICDGMLIGEKEGKGINSKTLKGQIPNIDSDAK